MTGAEKREKLRAEMSEARKKYLEELNQTVIYKNGDAFSVGSSAFYKGGFDSLVPFDKDFFKWNVSEEASGFMEERVYSLTLGELKEQLMAAGFKGLMTLFVNRPMDGEIYQIGNYNDGEWCEIGTLNGFC